MPEKTMLQKIFIFVVALAICVLLVLDAVALVNKFGDEKTKEIVGSIATQGAASTPQTGTPTQTAANQDDASVSAPASQAPPTGEPGEFVAGQYYHELGEYGFGNTMLVPNILFNADGTFAFSENTGSGMGTCSGVYSLSSDGAVLTCNVTTADIACPDVITFNVSDDNAIVLNAAMKKSVAGDSFILRTEE